MEISYCFVVDLIEFLLLSSHPNAAAQIAAQRGGGGAGQPADHGAHLRPQRGHRRPGVHGGRASQSLISSPGGRPYRARGLTVVLIAHCSFEFFTGGFDRVLTVGGPRVRRPSPHPSPHAAPAQRSPFRGRAG